MFGSDIIRVKIKGFLKNITDNDILNFDEKGIKNKNKISFVKDEIKYFIMIHNNMIEVVRETDEYVNSFVFDKDKASSLYTLKEFNQTLEIKLMINSLDIEEDSFDINYTVLDTSCSYELKMEIKLL